MPPSLLIWMLFIWDHYICQYSPIILRKDDDYVGFISITLQALPLTRYAFGHCCTLEKEPKDVSKLLLEVSWIQRFVGDG